MAEKEDLSWKIFLMRWICRQRFPMWLPEVAWDYDDFSLLHETPFQTSKAARFGLDFMNRRGEKHYRVLAESICR
jgi:hypothetical protein